MIDVINELFDVVALFINYIFSLNISTGVSLGSVLVWTMICAIVVTVVWVRR